MLVEDEETICHQQEKSDTFSEKGNQKNENIQHNQINSNNEEYKDKFEGVEKLCSQKNNPLTTNIKKEQIYNDNTNAEVKTSNIFTEQNTTVNTNKQNLNIINKQSTNFTKFDLNYKLLEVIGEGTFGKVYKGTKNGRLYGIKKINQSKNGLHITTIREIKYLRILKHKNIIELLEINIEKSDIYLIFDYYQFDLRSYLRRNIPNNREIVHIIKQISNGLHFLKSKNILHRDLKSSNILLDFNLNIKIADFGMAIATNKKSCYSPGVVTLWYRPPEILLGATYGVSCDIWSLGCIFAELFLGSPLFHGHTEFAMLENIIQVCGSINIKTFPGLPNLQFQLPQSQRTLRNKLKNIGNDFFDLIDKMLIFDIEKRITIENILSYRMFVEHDDEYLNKLCKRYEALEQDEEF